MCEAKMRKRKIVSVVLPVLNEAKFIRETVTSLLAQDAPDFDLEVLVVDANSDDGSREVVAELARADARVRLLTNEKRRTPFAFNIGLREAKGDYVAILGAHNVYQKDYLSVCLRELLAKGVAGCSGRVIARPANESVQARLVCMTLAHSFGSSGKSFRTQPEGFAETIPYPLMVKRVLVEAGGYDEGMLRNQDNDINRKLRVMGHKLYCTWKTSCFYHTPPSARALFKYAFNNGFWNVISLKENFGSMGLRHFVPFAFLVAVLCSLALCVLYYLSSGSRPLLFAAPLLLVLGSHVLAGATVAVGMSLRKRDASALLLPFVFLALHLSYGWGTLWGFLTNAKKPDIASPSLSHATAEATSDN